jgi:hypothetical protein
MGTNGAVGNRVIIMAFGVPNVYPMDDTNAALVAMMMMMMMMMTTTTTTIVPYCWALDWSPDPYR